MNNLNLGDKIRFFRKRLGWTQMQLELEINAAPGMISRIEVGQVNPTKETLHTISKNLKLNQREKAELFDFFSIFPSEDEVKAATEECKDYFARTDVYGYLLDEYGVMYAASLGFVNFFNLSMDESTSLMGKSIFEVILNNKLPIREFLDPKYIPSILALELARRRVESNIELYQRDTMNQLQRFPEFTQAWELSKTYKDELFSNSLKIAHFIINGQKVRFNFSREKLKNNPRFEIIEFTNPVSYA